MGKVRPFSKRSALHWTSFAREHDAVTTARILLPMKSSMYGQKNSTPKKHSYGKTTYSPAALAMVLIKGISFQFSMQTEINLILFVKKMTRSYNHQQAPHFLSTPHPRIPRSIFHWICKPDFSCHCRQKIL